MQIFCDLLRKNSILYSFRLPVSSCFSSSSFLFELTCFVQMLALHVGFALAVLSCFCALWSRFNGLATTASFTLGVATARPDCGSDTFRYPSSLITTRVLFADSARPAAFCCSFSIGSEQCLTRIRKVRNRVPDGRLDNS